MIIDIIKILLVIGGALLLLIWIESRREIKSFVVTPYEIYSEKLNGSSIKVILLADLHSKIYDQENESIIQAIIKEQPDMILIAGDMIIGRMDDTCEVSLQLITKLATICPIYYANGNHEQRIKESVEIYHDKYRHYKQSLEDVGVTMLENNNVQICMKGNKLDLFGIEIPLTYFKKYNYSKSNVSEIESLIGEARCSCENYQILLAHNPTLVDSYLKWGADLVLSGHLHGGIIRIPFWGGIITPQVHLFPKYSGGHYRVSNSDLVVSKGIGEHSVNIRIFNKPEIVSITLNPK